MPAEQAQASGPRAAQPVPSFKLRRAANGPGPRRAVSRAGERREQAGAAGPKRVHAPAAEERGRTAAPSSRRRDSDQSLKEAARPVLRVGPLDSRLRPVAHWSEPFDSDQSLKEPASGRPVGVKRPDPDNGARAGYDAGATRAGAARRPVTRRAARAPGKEAATVNVRTQEAIEVLAVCLYHKRKSLTRPESGSRAGEGGRRLQVGSGGRGPGAPSPNRPPEFSTASRD